MRKLTVALLSGAYICIALIAAVLVWRVGGGAGAGSAALIGSLGLCFAIQGLVARLSQATQLAGEIAAVREAHLILAGEIEEVQARVAGMVDTISQDAFRRSEEIYSEVQLLASARRDRPRADAGRVPLGRRARRPGRGDR
jgi:cyclic-di-GMP phosphodiesterase, flagellum assembly factor TipF